MAKFSKKHVILCILAIFIIAIAIKMLLPYRWGYFAKGPAMKYEHKYADAIKLDNGNILVLGTNSHQRAIKDNNLEIKETPSEIYNIKNNTFETVKLPNTIAYHNKGILLKNNKLLLTFAYAPYGAKKYSKYGSPYDIKHPFPYDSMAIIDLNTMKIEKIIQKKINKTKRPTEFDSFTLLNNGKVLILDGTSQPRSMEIYNPETNTSKLLNIKINKTNQVAVVPNGENKALIFGESYNKDKDKEKYYGDLDTVLEYDDSTETIKTVGKNLRRLSPQAIRINNENILLLGGHISRDTFMQKSKFHPDSEVEVYNTKTNTSKIIGHLAKRRYSEPHDAYLDFTTLFIGKDILLITGGYEPSIPSKISTKDTEIIDIKTGKISKGPKMRYRESEHKMLKLKNGKFIIIGSKKTQLFKTWKGGD